jgi:Ring finger domain
MTGTKMMNVVNPIYAQPPLNNEGKPNIVWVDGGDKCPVCWNKVVDAKTYLMTPCQHFFCRPCTRKCDANDVTSCPVCRTLLGIACLEEVRVLIRRVTIEILDVKEEEDGW